VAPGKSGVPDYDHGLLVAFVPYLLAGLAVGWWFMTGIIRTGEFVLVFVFVLVAFVPPTAVLWTAIDDAKKGFVRGSYVQHMLLLFAPLLLVVAVLMLAVLLSLVSMPQAIGAGGIVVLASLPAAVLGAVKLHQNRKLPDQDPRGAA